MHMKINWRVLVAVVVIVGAIFWMVDSVRPRSYSGSNLTFLLGNGAVTVTNPSDTPVASQLTGTGSRAFTVSSITEGLSGTSTSEGTGSKTTQLFAFDLPSGVSTFTVTRGTNASFAGTTDSKLQASADPLTPDNARTTLIVGIALIVAALFYISRTTGHRWLSALRGIPAVIPVPVVETAPVVDANRGRDGRMYSNYGGKD
jgi:hypothetical protein